VRHLGGRLTYEADLVPEPGFESIRPVAKQLEHPVLMAQQVPGLPKGDDFSRGNRRFFFGEPEMVLHHVVHGIDGDIQGFGRVDNMPGQVV
jgi:hypothetical protein